MSKSKNNKPTVASKEATVSKEKVVGTTNPVAEETSDSTEEKATIEEVGVIKNRVNPLNNNRKKANQLFELYPDAKEIHFTQDGKAFFEENNANSHASVLTIKLVEKIKRK